MWRGDQQRLGAAIPDLDRESVDAHRDQAADRRGPRRIMAAIDAYGGVVPHGTHDFREVAEACDRQRPQMWLLLPEHGLDLPPGAAMDAFGRPVLFPVPQKFVLGLDRTNRRPASAVPCVCWIAFSTVPLRFGSRTRAGSATAP